MKPLLVIVCAALACAILWQARPAFPQGQFRLQCENGVCTISEADVDRLQLLINALVNRILELQDKTGCI